MTTRPEPPPSDIAVARTSSSQRPAVPNREAVEGLLVAVARALPRDGKSAGEPLEVMEKPSGATWVTRTGVHVDRIASAWLIRRFIDPAAT